MKNYKLTIVIMSLFLFITACGGGNDKKAKTPEENSTMQVIHLTKAEFIKRVSNYEAKPSQWKYEGNVPCVVDFYATWCGPCKMLSPIMESLATEYHGKLIIYKVDIDQEEELASEFGVQSIPTLLWVPMSGDPFVTRGSMTKAELKKIVDEKLVTSK